MPDIDEMNCSCGDFQALRDVSLTVNEGEIAALLGPNAAEKSTTLAAISGRVKCRSGPTLEIARNEHVKKGLPGKASAPHPG